MPTYDYECQLCNHRFEAFQSIKAPPLKRCPSCGKSKVRRLIGTGGGLIFKGSGFYCTDYRDSSYQSAASKDGGSSSASTGGETKSSETKSSGTETKPESKKSA